MACFVSAVLIAALEVLHHVHFLFPCWLLCHICRLEMDVKSEKSRLLTKHRLHVFSQTLCSAVVQVYVAERSYSWVKRCCGVACLVKDNPQRSYFIRVFDIKVSGCSSKTKHHDESPNISPFSRVFRKEKPCLNRNCTTTSPSAAPDPTSSRLQEM